MPTENCAIVCRVTFWGEWSPRSRQQTPTVPQSIKNTANVCVNISFVTSLLIVPIEIDFGIAVLVFVYYIKVKERKTEMAVIKRM